MTYGDTQRVKNKTRQNKAMHQNLLKICSVLFKTKAAKEKTRSL